MRVAIVGAGFSGLVTAKTLVEFGHDVAVFEMAPDIGGVWSATRRYPGLETQNNKDTYRFSDVDWPRHVPEWPTSRQVLQNWMVPNLDGPLKNPSRQVQQYLEQYTSKFGFEERIRLGTEVLAATRRPSGGWMISFRTTVDAVGAAVEEVVPIREETFDHLVVCNGLFCDSFVPSYAGLEEHASVGGRVCHTNELRNLDDVAGRDVVVVGYGKSACDGNSQSP
jgi:dimethylaniline monooxygenase (N-oxide forming)